MNNQPVDHQPDETRFTSELDKILDRNIEYNCQYDATIIHRNLIIKQILSWHETEKQKLLKQVWNLSQPDIVPEGWKPYTKLGKFLKENIE